MPACIPCYFRQEGGQAGCRVRAGLGHRNRQDCHAAACVSGAFTYSRRGRESLWPGLRRQPAHFVRRLGKARKRQGAHGGGSDRRGTGGRRQPRSEVVWSDREILSWQKGTPFDRAQGRLRHMSPIAFQLPIFNFQLSEGSFVNWQSEIGNLASSLRFWSPWQDERFVIMDGNFAEVVELADTPS